MNPTAKTPRRTLEKQADKLVQTVGLALCKRKCIGYSDSCLRLATEMHHIVGRRVYPEARHEALNLVPVCDTCHRLIEDNKQMFLGWLRTNLPAHYGFHYVITRGELPRTTEESLRAKVAVLRGIAI